VEGGAANGRPGRLLVLGAGPGQLGLLEAARARGLYVVAVDRDPSAPGFRFADRRAIVSVEDEPAVDRLASAERVDGLIAPGIDFPVGVAARVAERQGIRHPLSAESALLSVSKQRQRERFAAAGVPHARFQLCSTPEEARAAAEGLGYPCVVKAPDRQGQKGLTLVEAEVDLPDAFDAALSQARSSAVLVEERVAGREVTVNAFSSAGSFRPLTVTDRLVADAPAFGVALAHIWPSDAVPGRLEAAVEVARAAAEAIGVHEGPTYTQVLVGPDRVVVGELAARLGGGHDAELCQAALGVDLNGLALAAALGEDIPSGTLSSGAMAGGACIRFVVPPAGRLESVAGVEEARASEGVVWVRVYRGLGHEFGSFRRGSDRAGAVLAVGDSRQEAIDRATGAAERIRFLTADAEALVHNPS
jgi:biotin carboxylase